MQKNIDMEKSRYETDISEAKEQRENLKEQLRLTKNANSELQKGQEEEFSQLQIHIDELEQKYKEVFIAKLDLQRRCDTLEQDLSLKENQIKDQMDI